MSIGIRLGWLLIIASGMAVAAPVAWSLTPIVGGGLAWISATMLGALVMVAVGLRLEARARREVAG